MANSRFYRYKYRGFLSTPETLLHPINGTECPLTTRDRELVCVLKDDKSQVLTGFEHRVVSYREFIRLKNYALIYLRWNFCEMTINDKAIPENLVC